MGCAIVLLLLLAAAIFVLPAALLGHLVGLTPSIGQVLRGHPSGWMHRHYPDVGLRFVIVDAVLFLLLLSFIVGWRRTRRRSRPWMAVFTSADGSTYRGHGRFATEAEAHSAAQKIATVTADGETVSVRSFEIKLDPAINKSARQAQKSATADPWMIVFIGPGGGRYPGNARYGSEAAAQHAASTLTSIDVDGQHRPVEGYVIAFDASRDPELAQRKRRAAHMGKGRAFCTRCYRPLYPGTRFCECGAYHDDGWEQRFQQTHGTAATPRRSSDPPNNLVVRRPVQTSSETSPPENRLDTQREAPRVADPAAVPAAGGGLTQQLRELADLHERGALSDAEFTQAKDRLLSADA